MAGLCVGGNEPPGSLKATECMGKLSGKREERTGRSSGKLILLETSITVSSTMAQWLALAPPNQAFRASISDCHRAVHINDKSSNQNCSPHCQESGRRFGDVAPACSVLLQQLAPRGRSGCLHNLNGEEEEEEEEDDDDDDDNDVCEKEI
ncbi:hypothetical protein ANN_02663 [Periplaneta americana]|uniref:Uncharacterized protein n=1 Tax=Periplaneta americana TaxID=6978 RepID=A0ABQ8TZE1_PERAM|nr:hypothetical protein ANN_02663 [Periplaneta americana]